VSLAQINRDKITICYDNFDYSEDVRHQTLRDPAKHVSATTGKLCIGHYMPPGGLRSSMLHPRVPLDPCDILQAAGNEDDTILHACQRHWIAEAIRYTHRTAVEKLLATTPLPQRNQETFQTGRNFLLLSVFLHVRRLTMLFPLF